MSKKEGKVIIIMGSKKDLDYANSIKEFVNKFNVTSILRIASGHKTPEKVLEIIDQYKNKKTVFITIAGKSNALSGLVDANTDKPVIASPPYSDKYSGIDVFSSLRMPSGVAPMVVLGAEQAALSAIKILGLSSPAIKEKIEDYQTKFKEKIEKEDSELIDG